MQQETQTQTKAQCFSIINAACAESKGFELAMLRKDYRYGVGVILLEEKIISNSPSDEQDMQVNDFIQVALACMCAPNYNQVGTAKYAK